MTKKELEAKIKAYEDFILENIHLYKPYGGPEYLSFPWVEDSELDDPTGMVTKLIKERKS